MQKQLAILEIFRTNGLTGRLTRQGESRVSATKNDLIDLKSIQNDF